MVGIEPVTLPDAAKPRAERYFVWCGSLSGFGARAYPSGKNVFVAQMRFGRAQRRVAIGPYGVFTVERARQRAEAMIRARPKGAIPSASRRKRAMRSLLAN